MKRLDTQSPLELGVMQSEYRQRSAPSRRGAVAIVLAIPQPALFWIAALAVDAGMVTHDAYRIQQVASSAAAAAAQDKRQGHSDARASETANHIVKEQCASPSTQCVVQVLPHAEARQGGHRHVEVVVKRDLDTMCMNVMHGIPNVRVSIRAVAAWERKGSLPLVVLDNRVAATKQIKTAPVPRPQPMQNSQPVRQLQPVFPSAPPRLPPVAGGDNFNLQGEQLSLKDALLVKQGASTAARDPSPAPSNEKSKCPFQSTNEKAGRNVDRNAGLGWKSLLGFALTTALIYGLLKLCANHVMSSKANDESQSQSAGGVRASSMSAAASDRAPPRLFSR